MEKNKETPFKEQYQNPPGLQKRMTPVPDSGEETYTGSGQLTGKKMLVTGGDSGIGRAVAIAYAREDADVTITYLPEEKEDALEVQEIIKSIRNTAFLIPGNLEDESFCQMVVEKAYEKMGGLDNITLVAGHQQYEEDITKLSTEEIIRTYTINVFSIFLLTKASLKFIPKGGSIITTSSVQAKDPSAHLLDYASSKGAISNLTKGLAKQLVEREIRVNAVAPGPIWTPLQISGGQPQKNIPEFGTQSPMKRAGQPVEVAGAYVFLASDKASYVTGQIYGVTGGELS
ncbi:SDR family oxidoreductase [Vagococcus fluvialis]|uniref:SDR family oxidoreductase n=1 Tax=Vagococcus fluvialis TaxID=2738 RepID=UPI003D103898